MSDRAAIERRKEKRVRSERRSAADLSAEERVEKQTEARRLHDAGLGYKRIARELGLTPKTIGRWIRGGWPRAKRQGRPRDYDRRALVFALVEAGWPDHEIAREMGWAESSTHRAIHNYREEGLPLRVRPRGGCPGWPRRRAS